MKESKSFLSKRILLPIFRKGTARFHASERIAQMVAPIYAEACLIFKRRDSTAGAAGFLGTRFPCGGKRKPTYGSVAVARRVPDFGPPTALYGHAWKCCLSGFLIRGLRPLVPRPDGSSDHKIELIRMSLQ